MDKLLVVQFNGSCKSHYLLKVEIELDKDIEMQIDNEMELWSLAGRFVRCASIWLLVATYNNSHS